MRTKTKSGKLSGFSEKTSDIILVAVCAVVLFLVAYPLYYVCPASLRWTATRRCLRSRRS